MALTRVPNSVSEHGSPVLSSVVEDLSPQLGANLDMNTFDITTSEDGGIVNIISGNSAASNGGALNLTAGDGGGTGAGGDVIIDGGAGGGTSGDGGSIVITPGAQSVGVPGTIDIAGYNGSSGGSLVMLEGSGNGTNSITLKAPDAITTDRTWVLPVDDPADATGQVLTTNSSGELSFIPTTSRNLLINGDMRIWQRGTSFASIANNNYSADRWQNKLLSSTGAVTIAKGASSVGVDMPFINVLSWDVITADTSIAIGEYAGVIQKIEAFNTTHLRFGKASASPITVSFWHRHTLTGTYCVSVRNSGGNRSYIAEYTQTTTNTWEYTSVTIPGDTSGTWLYDTNGIGISVKFTYACGTTFQTTAGSWAAGNYFASSNQVNALGSTLNFCMISNVQVEAGDVATAFEKRLLGTELVLCQRYFEKSIPMDTTPADDAIAQAYNGPAIGTTDIRVSVNFKVEKRTNGYTMTYYRPSLGSTAGKWSYYNAGWNDATGTNDDNPRTSGTRVQVVGTGLTAGYSYLTQGGWTADNEL